MPRNLRVIGRVFLTHPEAVGQRDRKRDGHPTGSKYGHDRRDGDGRDVRRVSDPTALLNYWRVNSRLRPARNLVDVDPAIDHVPQKHR
jgi:hypothetical protein